MHVNTTETVPLCFPGTVPLCFRGQSPCVSRDHVEKRDRVAEQINGDRPDCFRTGPIVSVPIIFDSQTRFTLREHQSLGAINRKSAKMFRTLPS